tara:strand:- start:172 stop:387 length:216 start_codon:yes stop_codon:yes gene_type:complete
VNSISAKKLLNSKWTILNPTNKEKHFIITELEFDENNIVTHCLIEAVISNRSQQIDWTKLRDTSQWIQGWK